MSSRKLIYLILLLFVAGGFGCGDKAVSKKKTVVPEKADSSSSVVISDEAQPKVEKEIYVYNAGGRRDPFQSLIEATKVKAERKKGVNPVENYDVNEIRLIAIAWDAQQYYAMITLPDNKSYTVRKGMTLGLNDGKITNITREALFIKELVKDYKGQFNSKDTILRLRKEEEE
jgi:type IV pilus assembly protein PilP